MSSDFLEGAFNFGLSKVERRVHISRPGEFHLEPIKMAVSNYTRNLAAPEDVIVQGQEFVISKKSLDETQNFTTIKRGDVITDPDLGERTITEVIPMFGLGSKLMGYRVRVE